MNATHNKRFQLFGIFHIDNGIASEIENAMNHEIDFIFRFHLNKDVKWATINNSHVISYSFLNQKFTQQINAHQTLSHSQNLFMPFKSLDYG